MNENFQKAQDICIEHAAQISDLFGLSDGMARILALLYLSPEPVSIPVICEKLSLTKGTVSLYLRLLEERKIIARAWSKKEGEAEVLRDESAPVGGFPGRHAQKGPQKARDDGRGHR